VVFLEVRAEEDLEGKTNTSPPTPLHNERGVIRPNAPPLIMERGLGGEVTMLNENSHP
jgi:hypothetical protein